MNQEDKAILIQATAIAVLMNIGACFYLFYLSW
jgi:hypothetical protein